MERYIVVCAMCVLCLGAGHMFAGAVEITYSADQIGGDSWQYTYTVANNGIVAGVEAFTI